MKRYIALFSILVVFASLLVGCDINRMGKISTMFKSQLMELKK